MDTKKKRSGGFGSIFFMIIIIGIVWAVIAQMSQRTSNYKYKDFESDLKSGRITDVVISQNAEVPTGTLTFTDGSRDTLNVSDVVSVQEKLDDKNITYTVRDVKRDSVWMTTILPFGMCLIVVVALMLMMTRQAGGGGNAKMMNFGKSRARMMLPDDKKVTFQNVAGLQEEKEDLVEVVDFLKAPQKYTNVGARIPKGVILVGPPGTGKTLLAKAVASESEANFISIKGPELLSKWVGESEQGVREVFRKAKQTAPTVIFFDEIDSIASTRSANDSDSGVTKRVVNQLLTEMDGLEELEDVAIIAATNRPDILDAGLMRPGRFDRHIKVDLPNEDARLSIFKVHTEGMPLADDVSLEKLAKQTDGYVGADIEAVCREAAMLTLRNNLDAENVPYKYFKEALEKVKPSNSPGDQVQYI